jgi:hypothetical protein
MRKHKKEKRLKEKKILISIQKISLESNPLKKIQIKKEIHIILKKKKQTLYKKKEK